jgi:hypothetical protein
MKRDAERDNEEKDPIPIAKFDMSKQDGEDAERHRGCEYSPALKKEK